MSPGEKRKAKAVNAKALGYPADWLDKVIVEQWEQVLMNGTYVEVPKTRMVQTYDPMFYDRMLKENFFAESSWGHEVKHDPRK